MRIHTTRRALGAAGLAALAACAGPPQAESARAPVELGLVAWERDHSQAVRRAEAQGRDLLMLFQEVPG